MKNLEMLQSRRVSRDGINIEEWEEGSVQYDVPDDLARSLMSEDGVCKVSRKKRPEPKVETKDKGDEGNETKGAEE